MTEVWSCLVNSPLFVVFNMVINFASLILFLRFLLQFASIDNKNPLVKSAKTLSAITDVFSTIFPTVNQGRVNTSALALLYLLMLIKTAGTVVLLKEPATAMQVFFAGSVEAILLFLDALRWTIIGAIACSFIVMLSSSSSVIIQTLMRLADPIIEPFRKISPDLGMIDIAPLFAMLALSFTKMVIEIVAQNLFIKL